MYGPGQGCMQEPDVFTVQGNLRASLYWVGSLPPGLSYLVLICSNVIWGLLKENNKGFPICFVCCILLNL